MLVTAIVILYGLSLTMNMFGAISPVEYSNNTLTMFLPHIYLDSVQLIDIDSVVAPSKATATPKMLIILEDENKTLRS